MGPGAGGSALSDRRFVKVASGLLEGVVVALALFVWFVVSVVALAESASCLFRVSISLLLTYLLMPIAPSGA